MFRGRILGFKISTIAVAAGVFFLFKAPIMGFINNLKSKIGSSN